MNRAAVLALAMAPVFAQEPFPPIAEIDFAGNKTTQPRVMQREMTVVVGDPADPVKIERSRQGILDLGLFKSVRVQQTAVPGGVRLTFQVEEKWYFLPIPRASTNSDGKNSYGLSLRWFNVAGLNHTLRGSWANSDDQKANKGRRTRYGLDYGIPFVFDSQYNFGLGLSHSSTPILATPDYVETFDSASVGLSRTFSAEVASQGWTVGGSLTWINQDTQGDPGTPPPYGAATALGLSADYRDVRFRVFSEEGIAYGVRASSAAEGAGSDYSFNVVAANWSRFLPLGTTPHQNLNLYAGTGSYHGGARGVKSDSGQYSLGGAGSLRGYAIDRFQGDAYYHLLAEILRPVGRDWLRALLIVEAGNVFGDAHDFSLSHTNASAGVGVRVRFTSLVNFELEAGVAWPLDGGGARFFASAV